MFHASMRRTFLLLCIVIVTLISVVFFISLFTTRQTLVHNANSYLHMTHRQVRDNIEGYLRDIESIAYSMCYSPSVQQYLKQSDPLERLELFTDVQSVFSNISYMNNALMGFSIYDGQGGFLTANGMTYQAITSRDRIDIGAEARYRTLYPPNRYIGSELQGFVLTIPIYESRTNTLSSNRIGALVFTVSLSYIVNQIHNGDLYDGSAMLLLDGDSRVMVSSGATAADGGTPEEGMTTLDETAIADTGWTLATTYRVSVLSEDMQMLWQMIIITGISIIVLVLVFLWLISRSILRPIENVSRFMQDISRHPQLREYIPPRSLYVELRTMADSMNLMIRALDQKAVELLEQEKRTSAAEMAAGQLEILAYRSQVNPHFLYNTLDCISGMAYRYNAPEIADISLALSGMFRYAVRGKDFVTVEEEVLHMREYATIIQHRFMGRIQIAFDVAPQAAQLSIPRLVMQPVLENAVFHGVEKKLGAGQIDVVICVEGDTLLLRVSDNGLGMTSEQAAALHARLEAARGTQSTHAQDGGGAKGVGLWNVAHRLHLFYQGGSTLMFESAPQEGTRVEIRLPIRHGEVTA